MHRTRLIVSLILIPLLLVFIVKAPPVWFLVLIMAIVLIAQYEYYAMARIGRPWQVAGLAAGAALMVMTYRGGAVYDDFFAVAFIAIAALRLFGKGTAEGSLRDVGCMVTGIVYLPLLLGYQIKLREFSPWWIIYADCCVWAADSAAYYVGKSVGKRRLYEAISPKKTVAGAWGSLGGAVLLSVVVNEFFLKAYVGAAFTLPQAVVAGLVIGAVSIAGDLVESMFKRDAGVKDSSAILPGHGGLLDKVDGMVFVAPVLYWIITRVFVV